MASKWVLDLSRFELVDYFVWQLCPCRIPAVGCLHPSANLLANARCVVQNSAPRFCEPKTLESKICRVIQMLYKRFSVERARKLLGEVDLEDGVAPVLQQPF